MKHNWEYKNWDEVLTIINGKNQKAVENPKGLYPIYGSGGIMSYANDYLCPENAVIIGRKGSINNPIYVETKFWNVDTAFGIVANGSMLQSKFLYYFCVFYDFMKHNKATTLPSLVKSDLLKIQMPVPPMVVQEKIVAELDEINGLIETKREQLKQFDLLAQSIFYTMFDAPVTNSKGWETHKFSDTFKLKSGSGLSAKDIESGSYPVYGGNGVVGYHKQYNITGENIIIGRVGALCGNVRCVKGNAYITDNAFILTHQKGLNNIFTLYLLNILNLRQYAKAVAQPVISNVALKDLTVIFPPLAIQQQFAAKVEAIESRKADIESTIKELQTLLDSRMDYWFN